MEDTATRESGPVDAPASIEDIVTEIEAGGEAPADALESVTQEMVNEAEGQGEAEAEAEAPDTEDDATEPADEAEEAEEEGNPDEETDEQLVTVKVNGEELQVPLSEALAGYSRLQDYKAKTAEVAEERRAIEAQKANLDAELKAQYADQLEKATDLFARFDPVLEEARKINWDHLKATDPAAYVQAQDAVNQRLAAIQQMRGQIEQLNGETQQHQQAQAMQERAERFDAAADAIVKAMPELADEGKFKAFASEAVSHLRAEGFSSDEIADSLDHRVLTLADKARRWDAHVAAQKSLPQRKVVPKSAVKPLKTDGSGSQASKPRFPANAQTERKVDWIAKQILSES